MENWKPIAGYEGIYEVSDLGRIKRIKAEHNTYAGRILTGGQDQDGYCVVLLYKDGKRRMFKFHRLVAGAFIPNPDNLPQVNHKNAVKNDNRAENLEWCDCQHNITHAVNKGLWNAAKGSNHGNSKLTELDVVNIREMHAWGYEITRIAKAFAVSDATIADVIAKRTWGWLL